MRVSVPLGLLIIIKERVTRLFSVIEGGNGVWSPRDGTLFWLDKGIAHWMGSLCDRGNIRSLGLTRRARIRYSRRCPPLSVTGRIRVVCCILPVIWILHRVHHRLALLDLVWVAGILLVIVGNIVVGISIIREGIV